MSHNLEHQKVHTRMVKEVLKAVARANNPPYQSVFADFITGHPSCTVSLRLRMVSIRKRICAIF